MSRRSQLQRFGKEYRSLLRFVRKNPKRWAAVIMPLWTLKKTIHEDVFFPLLQQLEQYDDISATALVEALIDCGHRVPKSHHQYLLSLLQKIEREVSILAFLEIVPELLFRFHEHSLSLFLDFCLQYSDPDLRIRALRGENTQSIAFSQELTGEDVLIRIRQSLVLYARAHCNFDVQIFVGAGAFTDGRHIHLPARLEVQNPELQYRIMTAIQAGYLEFGTLDITLEEIAGSWEHRRDDELEIERMFRSFGNPVLAKDIFLILENHRICSHLAREYPGIAQQLKDFQFLKKQSQQLAVVERYIEELYAWIFLEKKPQYHVEITTLDFSSLNCGGVHDTVLLTQTIYAQADRLLVHNATYREREHQGASLQTKRMRQHDRRMRIAFERKKQEHADLAFDFQEASEFMDRMPPPGGPERNQEEGHHPVLIKDTEPLEGEWCYPEWDFEMEDSKPDFTRVIELAPQATGSDFVRDVRHQYHAEIQEIKRVFSAIRLQNNHIERNQESGSLINIDKVIQNRISRHLGIFDSRVYMSPRPKKRSVSVAFVVDLSSSTNERIGGFGKRIIDLQKEALVLISEALHAVDDFFSIYGFSGYGRDQVAVYCVKEEQEPWGDVVQQRLGNLAWKMENRDGAAIRHVSQKLQAGAGKTKVLFLISDGRPLDCGCHLYHDRYAQEDTRQALQETRNMGIHPFCITVDQAGADYLEAIYGQSFAVIDTIEALPIQLPSLYRRCIQ